MNPKARQAKSKARLARFESLSHEDEAAAAAARASLESIFIPPGRPLGTVVVEAKVSLAPIVAGAPSLNIHYIYILYTIYMSVFERFGESYYRFFTDWSNRATFFR